MALNDTPGTAYVREKRKVPVVALVATTEAVPESVGAVEAEPTESVPVVLIVTPVKVLTLLTLTLTGVTTNATETLCDCPPEVPVTVIV